jgi:FtsH-binding integral membrane protein
MNQGFQGMAERSAGRTQYLDARSRFITRTYNHLFGAIVAFTALEIALFKSGFAEVIARAMLGGSWLIVLGGFTLASWLFTRIAHTAETLAAQYLALLGFVVAEAIVFIPLLFVANAYAPGTIQSAGIVTMLGFAGLTAVAFVTKKDFSFMRSLLVWGGVVALVAIVASVLFGFALGTFFSVAMVGLAGCAILYDTSNVLRAYPEDRYVGAALQLFASVAMMFWYVLRIFMSMSSRR